MCAPVVEGAEAVPAFAVRSGLTAAIPLLGKYFPALLKAGPVNQLLTGPATDLMEKADMKKDGHFNTVVLFVYCVYFLTY